VLITLMLQTLGPKHFGLDSYPAPALQSADYSNIKALGDVLYTQYVLPFELSAVILLVAIISAISLVFRGRQKNSKSQNITGQIAANKANRLRIVHNMSHSP
jgi:NADH-quinone oxidoreductase subunit J